MWLILVIIAVYLFWRITFRPKVRDTIYYFRVPKDKLPEFLKVTKENGGEIVSVQQIDTPHVSDTNPSTDKSAK